MQILCTKYNSNLVEFYRIYTKSFISSRILFKRIAFWFRCSMHFLLERMYLSISSNSNFWIFSVKSSTAFSVQPPEPTKLSVARFRVSISLVTRLEIFWVVFFMCSTGFISYSITNDAKPFLLVSEIHLENLAYPSYFSKNFFNGSDFLNASTVSACLRYSFG